MPTKEVVGKTDPALPEQSMSYLTPSLIRWRKYSDGPLIALIVASLPLLILEVARTELSAGDELFLDFLNGFIFVAFLVDYVVEICLASNRRSYIRKEWLAAVIVVTQGLAVFPMLAAFGFVRGVRAVRALRALVVLFRLIAIGGLLARDGRSILSKYAARTALGAAAFTWLTAAVAFTLVEDVGRNQRLGSFFDALWWSTSTMTTVGYGDIYPTTSAGRVVGGITMIVGISAFAVVTARVSSFLVQDRSGQSSGSVGAQVRDLAGLRDEGLMSELEFETKRRELIGID
jgi:voltage-gated potassium channel